MKKRLVSVNFFTILVIFLFAVQVNDCEAQKNATRKFEKETFGKSRRSAQVRESGESRAAAKAMKEQERKAARREKEDDKMLKEMRNHHYSIQSEEAKARMDNNSRTTAEKYKAKRQKQQKEQIKPELRKAQQPGTKKARVKADTKDPAKQPTLKQNKKKVKTVDPKKQPGLKQHKVRKY